MREPQIPKNDCRGCAERDRIIDGLARHVDELTASDLQRAAPLSQFDNVRRFPRNDNSEIQAKEKVR